MDLCFIIDSSGSIRHSNPTDGSYDNWQLQLAFISQLLNELKISPQHTRVGAVVFSEDSYLAFPLNQFDNGQSIKEVVNQIPFLGDATNTPEGFKVAREECFVRRNGDRPGVSNLALFISDGEPFPDERRDPAIRQAQQLKDNNDVQLIAIGITDQIDKAFLKAVSSPPQIEGQTYFLAADFTVLETVKKSLIGALPTGTCEVEDEGISASRLKFVLFLNFSFWNL